MRYVYFEDEKTGGKVCAGYELGENKINVAVSFCSPQDRFMKRGVSGAHTRLTGRMAKNRYTSIMAENPKALKYEDIALLIKEALNNAFPEGYADVKSFLKSNQFSVFPEFAGVRLPYWFSGV